MLIHTSLEQYIFYCSAGYFGLFLFFRLSNRTLVEDGMSLNGTTLFELRYVCSAQEVCTMNEKILLIY